MFEKLKQRILRTDRVCGLSITFLAHGGFLASVILLRLNKNKIVKEAEFLFIDSMDSLLSKIPINQPVALSVTGKGVLFKKIVSGEPVTDILERMLPNANHADFYVEAADFPGFTAVSICRKEIINNLIAQLSLKKIKVLSVGLGVRDIQNIIPFIDVKNYKTIRSANLKISMGEKAEVTDVSIISGDENELYEKSEYNLGDQYISAAALPGFGCAVGLIAGNSDNSTGVENSTVLHQRTEFKYYQYYKASVWGLLSFLFVLLLLSFLLYNHYFSRNNEIEVEQAIKSEQVKNIQKTEAGINSKFRFFQQLGWIKPRKLSFYADRIAGLVPTGTVLSGMQLFPSKTGFSFENTIPEFKQDTIIISGSCSEPTELTQFSNNLKNISDFRAVDIKHYSNRQRDRDGIFLLEIITK